MRIEIPDTKLIHSATRFWLRTHPEAKRRPMLKLSVVHDDGLIELRDKAGLIAACRWSNGIVVRIVSDKAAALLPALES